MENKKESKIDGKKIAGYTAIGCLVMIALPIILGIMFIGITAFMSGLS